MKLLNDVHLSVRQVLDIVFFKGSSGWEWEWEWECELNGYVFLYLYSLRWCMPVSHSSQSKYQDFGTGGLKGKLRFHILLPSVRIMIGICNVGYKCNSSGFEFSLLEISL
jgi:hypothetical protein